MSSRTVDGLTGLPGAAALTAALSQAIDTEDVISFATLDIDHFARVNETHGREAGDELLRQVAAIIAETAGENAFRVSGDSFAVLLPGVPVEKAFLKMEALRVAVEAAGDRLPVPVRVSVGVAEYPRHAKENSALMQAADAALVTAKEAGRNQVALPPSDDMVMKSCYYSGSSIRRLKGVAERLGRKESELLREALADLLRKYDRP
jgi:diguanylate cyclase (GGDEF)-like protein